MLLTLLSLFLLRQLILRSLCFTSFLIHNFEDGEEARGCDIADVLIEFEHEAAISDDFTSFFEALIEVGLFFQFNASIIKGIGVKSGEAILSSIFTFVVHDIVVVWDGMHVDKGALSDTTNPRTIFKTHSVRFTTRALHQLN